MAAQTESKGVAWLVEHVESKGFTKTQPELRVVLRALVANGTISRGEGRWEFKGVNDPAVKAVLAHLREAKKNPPKVGRPKGTKAETPKDEVAAKRRTSRKPKAAPEPEPEDDLDDLVEDDDELDLD